MQLGGQFLAVGCSLVSSLPAGSGCCPSSWPRSLHLSSQPSRRDGLTAAFLAECPEPGQHIWGSVRFSPGPRNFRCPQPHDGLGRGAAGARTPLGEPERN